MVIGGGGNQNGSISSSLEILESDLLNDNDFTEIGVAGHPEGSPDINQETINDFLNKKYDLSQNKNLNLELVTQFFFNAGPFIKWCTDLVQKNINLPVKWQLRI